MYELPPGQSVCPYHYEIGVEEWLIVLSGSPTLRTPAGEQELVGWDTAFFPNGEEGAHQVTNRTDETARIAILSNKAQPGVARVPGLAEARGLAAGEPLPPGRRRRLLGRRALSAWLGG